MQNPQLLGQSVLISWARIVTIIIIRILFDNYGVSISVLFCDQEIGDQIRLSISSREKFQNDEHLLFNICVQLIYEQDNQLKTDIRLFVICPPILPFHTSNPEFIYEEHSSKNEKLSDQLIY